MAEQRPTYTEAMAEIQRLLATPRTPASANPPPHQLPERLFPAISTALLREQFGNPDNMLRIAGERIETAKTLPGPLGRPDLEAALDLLALARHWLKCECWRPLMVEVRRPTQIVRGKGVAFVRQPSKQPALFSLGWWRGRRG